MSLELSSSEITELRRIQKKDRFHRRRFIKATVLLMLHRGLSYEDIQLSLSIDDNTITRYRNSFRQRGLKNYLTDGYVPYSGRLNEEQLAQLGAHLDTNLYIDAKAVCDYVLSKFGVKYSVAGMTAVLHRLGFVYKQTKQAPSRAEEEKQLEFLEQTLRPLLEEVDRGEAVVYFTDAAHPTHNTKPGRGWIRKGEDFTIDCNSGRKRVNINGAVNACKPEHLVYDIADTINAQSTKRLAQQLLRKHPGKSVYMICDNARYNRNRMLQDWAATQRIEFIFLPPYSPNLNLIERLWRFMRKEVLNSIYYDTYDKFKNSIVEFLDRSKWYKTDLRSLLTLNFRTVDQTSVHLT